MPYAIYMTEHIFRPLGMASTRIYDPTDIVPNRVSGYTWKDGRFRRGRTGQTGTFGGGDILSTVNDLAKWDVALDGDRLLPLALRQQIWTPARLNDGRTAPFSAADRGLQGLLLRLRLAPGREDTPCDSPPPPPSSRRGSGPSPHWPRTTPAPSGCSTARTRCRRPTSSRTPATGRSTTNLTYYTPNAGYPALRQAIADQVAQAPRGRGRPDARGRRHRRAGWWRSSWPARRPSARATRRWSSRRSGPTSPRPSASPGPRRSRSRWP